MTIPGENPVIRNVPTLFAALCLSAAASATPVNYTIDPAHTYPSFDADHMGMSTWHGKFNKTSGTIALDKAAGRGSVDIVIDASSIDFGLDVMNSKARSAELFDTTRFAQITYKGTLENFANGKPTRVAGELTLHGVTKPVELKIVSFKCMAHPMLKRDWCGADAEATINRAAFGIDAGKDWGFKMDTTLRIQVEAVAAQ
jgi:polyisoprenoid-binding protein YceI